MQSGKVFSFVNFCEVQVRDNEGEINRAAHIDSVMITKGGIVN